ncbi:MAG TPA: Asd/ArgC dimerization domain-containing protein [Terracidiphilus sp.]|nr:Asd/ArgC dimerization domain-containing protein [Terracidiphilus sp.]
MYKIAIAGASTLLGKELKESLSDSPLAAASFVLLDEQEALGQLDQVGDEVTFVQPIDAEAFDRTDFTFFCGSADLTRKHWKQALTAGSSVLDLSGALDQEAGVLVRAPWVGADAGSADLFTPAIVPAHPAALALVLILERIEQRAPIRSVAATLLVPASEWGRAAMDELHQQTINLLSFQTLPRAIYDAQAAYNMLSGLGENATVSLSMVEARVRRHFADLAGNRLPPVSLQAIQAPVFHGHTFSIALELERPAEIVTLEEALSGDHLDLVLEDTDSPSNLAATGQNDVLVRLRPDPGARNPAEASRVWIWAATDNLRLSAQNAVECALDLRRLRPQGTVQ